MRRFFFGLVYTARRSLEYNRQVYFVHSRFIKVFFEKEENWHFTTPGLFYHIPVFIVPA